VEQAEVTPGHPDWRPSWAVVGRTSPQDLAQLARQTALAAAGMQSAISGAAQAVAEFGAGMREGFERATAGLATLRQQVERREGSK
jgi:hypothetical protein